MKAIMVMFDSLNRRMLSPYGCDWVKTPNYQRLAERAVTFDNCYAGSLPCMPARRELHTGRYNFLHRSWGPIEPFDDSMPEILKENGVHTHLVSDHYHYWEEGGCNYHTRYSTWEISRGQEGEPWKAHLADNIELHEDSLNDHGGRRNPWIRQDFVNRHYSREEKDFPQAKTFAKGMEFLHTNHDQDNWFLQIETFDPHEPYYAAEAYRKLYPHTGDRIHFDWPPYDRVKETPAEVQHCRYESASLHTMCDAHLGKILDLMDRYDLWKDTMLIVNTDHGFMIGEHDWWGKCVMPFYDEVAHTPLFIWDPRSGIRGERRRSLVQTIDLPVTLLEYFGVDRPRDMQGHSLKDMVATDGPVREAALFGMHGGHVNVTDGRHVYMRAPVRPANDPLYQYTLMPTHMKRTFHPREFAGMTLAPPFSFTKGCQPMKIDGRHSMWVTGHEFGHLLFDLDQDPGEDHPLDPDREKAVTTRMTDWMVKLMRENDCPPEQFERLGLTEQASA